MKRAIVIAIVVLFAIVSSVTFADGRAHDHLTDHNWMLEIEGVTTGAVSMKVTNPKAKISCPDGKEAKFSMAKAPSAAQMKLLQKNGRYIIKKGKTSISLTGCNAPTYYKDDRVLTFKFDACR